MKLKPTEMNEPGVLDITPDVKSKPNDKDTLPKTKKATPKMIADILESPSCECTDSKDVPVTYDINNTIFIKGTPIEIKPTKLLYFRNESTDGFNFVRAVPLTELLKLPKGVLNQYSGDEIVYRFLYALFDGHPLFKKYYNEITAGDIIKAVDIFGRLNGIFEREEEAKRKKLEQQAKNP